MRIARQRQGGFTLVELALAIVLLGVLSYTVMGSYAYFARAQGELGTRDRMERLRTAFVSTYRSYARAVESVSSQDFFLSAGLSIANNSDVGTATTAAALTRVAEFGQLSPYEAQHDEFQGRFRFLVSNRLSSVMPAGYTVFYHKVAIVSPGYNRILEAGTTMNAATGAVTVAGDDFVVVVDGFQVQRELAENTVSRVDKVAKAYELYFTNRYLANPARDVSIDYFAATGPTPARWDAGGLAGNSGGIFANASAINMGAAIGVAANDLLDAYGTPIQVDNSSAATRNPENATTAMSIPPYSALVRASLVAGQTYTRSATGSF